MAFTAIVVISAIAWLHDGGLPGSIIEPVGPAFRARKAKGIFLVDQLPNDIIKIEHHSFEAVSFVQKNIEC